MPEPYVEEDCLEEAATEGLAGLAGLQVTPTRVPLCPVKWCPTRYKWFKGDKADWHACFCGEKAIEHHDAGAKGMSGGKDHHKRPENIVALCHLHHESIHTSECSNRILDLPTTGRTYVYYDTDGTVLHKQPLKEVMPDGDSSKLYGQRAVEGVEAGLPIATSRSQKRRLTAQGADFVDHSPGDSAGEAVLAVRPMLNTAAHRGSSPAPFSLETWKEQGRGLLEMGETLRAALPAWQFAVGDWFLAGEKHLGEEVYGHVDDIGFRSGTLQQYIWVASRVNPNTRVELDWTYHRHVAALETPKQKEWLEKAQKEHLTSRDLYRRLHPEKPKVKRWNAEQMREYATHFGEPSEGVILGFIAYLEAQEEGT
jgi:hypothetical protein